MARVIIKAIYNMQYLPAANQVHVVRMARKPKPELTELHQKALTAIRSRTSLIEKHEGAQKQTKGQQ
jgi:hypothetical protein